MSFPGQVVYRSLAANVDAAETSAALEATDLENTEAHVVAATAGTATLQVLYSFDGTNYVQAGSDLAAASDLPAAVNVPAAAKDVKLKASAYTDGEYTMTLGGTRKAGYA